LAHKKLGTWSKIKNDNKRKAVKTRYVYDIKRDSEGNVTRYKARLIAQGFNQVPGRDFDETWAPVPWSVTTRALFAMAAATEWQVHHVDVKTAFLSAKMDKEMFINLPDGTEPREAHEVFRLNLAAGAVSAAVVAFVATAVVAAVWGVPPPDAGRGGRPRADCRRLQGGVMDATDDGDVGERRQLLLQRIARRAWDNHQARAGSGRRPPQRGDQPSLGLVVKPPPVRAAAGGSDRRGHRGRRCQPGHRRGPRLRQHAPRSPGPPPPPRRPQPPPPPPPPPRLPLPPPPWPPPPAAIATAAAAAAGEGGGRTQAMPKFKQE